MTDIEQCSFDMIVFINTIESLENWKTRLFTNFNS